MLRTTPVGKALAFVVLLGSCGLALPAKATLVLDLGPGGFALPCDNICGNTNGRTFGWSFDVASTLQVNGLAAWDSVVAAFGRDVQAGLWTDAGALLASATISGSSPAEPSDGDGVWRVESIAALTLTPGQYLLGQVFFDDSPIIQSQAPISTIPEVTLVEGRTSSVFDGGLAFPDWPFVQPAFGPNLRLVQLPESSSVAMFGFGLGLIAIGSLIRRHRGY